MQNQTQNRSLLGEQLSKRLDQLGMSRREFSRRFNVSRQTLHELEHNPDKQFAPSTFQAIDEGLKWQAGTALLFHEGDPTARETVAHMTKRERMETYLTAIMNHLVVMDIDALEREVLMLEEEAYGNQHPEMPERHINDRIHEAIQKLVAAMAKG